MHPQDLDEVEGRHDVEVLGGEVVEHDHRVEELPALPLLGDLAHRGQVALDVAPGDEAACHVAVHRDEPWQEQLTGEVDTLVRRGAPWTDLVDQVADDDDLVVSQQGQLVIGSLGEDPARRQDQRLAGAPAGLRRKEVA